MDYNEFENKIFESLKTNSKTIIGAINEIYDSYILVKPETPVEPETPKPEEPEAPKPETPVEPETPVKPEAPKPEEPEAPKPIDPTLKLSYKFANTGKGSAAGTITLTSTDSKNNGKYAIYWGHNGGKVADYGRITTLTIKDKSSQSYNMLSLSAIPEGITKVIAVIDGTTEIKAEYNIESSKLLNGRKMRFGALSDIHIDGDGNDEAHSVSDFRNEIKTFKEKEASLICSCGDITCDGRESDVKLLVKELAKVDIPFYTVRGNHDCKNYCESKTNFSKINPNGLIFKKEVNGEVFIFMSLYKYEYNYVNVFSDEQLTQLKTILEENKNKRVFLFEHCFIGSVGNVNNIYGEYGGRTLSDSGTAGKFKKLLAKYRNVVIFTGHSHLEFDLQKYNEFANVKQRTSAWCHRVHCPSASKPRSKSSSVYNKYEGAYGYLVDVYDDCIVLKGRDFVNNKYLPNATYILDTKPIQL